MNADAHAGLDIGAEYEALVQFLYISPVGLVQASLDGSIAMINPNSAQLLMPLSPDGTLDNLFHVLSAVAPDLATRVSAFGTGYGSVCEGLQIRLDPGARGRSDPQVLSLTLLKLDRQRLMAVISDISQQVRQDRLLRQSQAWINSIVTGVTDYALVSLDAEGRIVDWNPSISRITAFSCADVVGQPYSIFWPAESTTVERVQDRLRDADESGWSLDDGWRLKADGTRFWGSVLIAPRAAHATPDGTGAPRGYTLVIRDITDKRQAGEQLRLGTGCDHLTGIADRRAFFEAAEIELARWQRSPRPLSLVIFDADHFKLVNDRHGHAAGDAVLRHLGKTLASTFREVDVVARIGGEEFAVLLPSVTLDAAMRIAERFRRAVEAAVVEVDGVAIRYTVSGGVAAMWAGLSDLAALMKQADEALYAAKRAGRNRVAGGG